jgi:hypothetical protein
MKKLLAVLLLLVVYPAHSQDYTYSQVQVPLQNINTSGGTNLQLGDDGMAYDVKIGFDFEFYGNIFDTINISNNGFLTFTGLSSMCCNGTELPAWGMDNSIMALWTDLININNTNPYYKSYAVNGDRVFTVGWYNTNEYYDTAATNTFEITLFRGSNNILFNYGDINIFNHTFTIGLQGTDGQFQQIYTGTNADQFDNTAYLFTYQSIELPPELPVAIDCNTNPTNINCILQSITAQPEIMLADANDNNQTITEEPITIAALGDNIDLESLLSSNETDTVQKEKEEKELRDDIQTSMLESVLAVTESNTNRNNKNSNETVEQNTTSETSIEQSVDDSQLLVSNQITVIDETSNIEDQSTTDELPVLAQQPQQMNEQENTISENTFEVSEEQYVENINNESINTSIEIVENVLVSNTNQIENELDELENILKNLNAQQKTFNDEEDEFMTSTLNITGMPNMVTIIQPFNFDSNMADKEASGAFGKVEDKSDAEKRAIEIIAANKEQQDNISNNYMDADQSGILGAMIVDTDVSAYRTSNIPDLSSWYKPEDIYKNIVYRDNVRGMYFLEKGSTDTYKQMVDEQYK